MVSEPFSEDAERLFSVVVVTVDDCKRFLDDVFCHKDCVCCTPRFYPLRIHFVSLWNLVEFLCHDLKFERFTVRADKMTVFFFNDLFKISLEILSDDINHFSESCLNGIVNGIIYDGFSVRTEAVHLLESSVAAAHSGSKNKKCWFHIGYLILLFNKNNYFCAKCIEK